MKKHLCSILTVLMLCAIVISQKTVIYGQENNLPSNVTIVQGEDGSYGWVFEGEFAEKDWIASRIYKDGKLVTAKSKYAGSKQGLGFKDYGYLSEEMAKNGPGVYTVGVQVKYEGASEYTEEVMSVNSFVYDNTSAEKLQNPFTPDFVAWNLAENKYYFTYNRDGIRKISIPDNTFFYVEHWYNGFTRWSGTFFEQDVFLDGSIRFSNSAVNPGDTLQEGTLLWSSIFVTFVAKKILDCCWDSIKSARFHQGCFAPLKRLCP